MAVEFERYLDGGLFGTDEIDDADGGKADQDGR